MRPQASLFSCAFQFNTTATLYEASGTFRVLFKCETLLTQRRSQQPVDNNVSVASDRGREVSVERNVECVVLKQLLILENTGTEVQRHLQNNNIPHGIQKLTEKSLERFRKKKKHF